MQKCRKANAVILGAIFSCFAFARLLATVPCAAELSLQEKVGQLLMVHFQGKTANEEAKALIQDAKVGGIIYYNWSNGLDSLEQIKALSNGIQDLAEGHCPPLLIAVDQEGGSVSRLNGQFPGNREVGETGNPEFAEKVAFSMGELMQSVGINMNLAPVVDVSSNPSNPVMGKRSFGSSAERVAQFGAYALKGYQRAGVIATLKHFPGYGDVTVDPHEDLPVVRKTKEELERIDLFPFAQLSATADAIMTAHILVSAWDDRHCATLSEKIVGYLRETLGFQGVIVTDSLVMEGVVKQCGSVDEAAIRALQAGCDLLILGGKLLSKEQRGFELGVSDVQRIHRAIVEAVESGRLPEARVDEAAARILELKRRRSV